MPLHSQNEFVTITSGTSDVGQQSNPIWVTGSTGGGTTTLLSGSVTGLLVGGDPASLNNPLPVTVSGTFAVSAADAADGAVGQPVPVTASLDGFKDPNGNLKPANVDISGNLIVTGSVSVNNFPAVQQVTGSVVVANTVNVTVQSGSITGLLVGGNPVSNANPIPVNLQDTSVAIDVTASISILPAVALVTGTVVGISGNVNVTQGTTPWVVSASNWVPTVTGSVSISEPVAVTQGTSPWVISGSNWVPTVTGSVVVSNRVDTRELANTASSSFVSASANASTMLLAANAARAGVTIFNNTNKNAWVLFGSPFTGMSASVGNFTTVLVPQDYYEVPFGYTGRIDAFSPNAANGAFQITELF